MQGVQKGAPTSLPQVLSKCSPTKQKKTPRLLCEKVMPEDGIGLLPSSLGDSEKEETEGASVVVRFLILVKIMARVPPPGDIASLPAGPLTYKPNLGPKRKPRPHPESISGQILITRTYYLTGAVQLSQDSNNPCKDPF